MLTGPKEKIGVIGLGYVGLPLAAAFAPVFDVVGYDTDPDRVEALNRGEDATGEVAIQHLQQPRLSFTHDVEDLRTCTFLVVAVPTPVSETHEPDLSHVKSASHAVGDIVRQGDMVVYESTVYPGVTEEVCLPILERASGLQLGAFDLGYSPERVNPGDKEHTIDKIVKIVSGHDEQALRRAAAVYGGVVKAGVYQAPNIKTAEAAKVIENVQRDLNIALMNELSKIFNTMGIHSDEVLAAAATKWNFHRYHPGLVGGHCIGVDPYYLTHRALQLGYHPKVILAGRRLNDDMGGYVARHVMDELDRLGRPLHEARVWLLGLTFKENVPDLRNTRAVDVIEALKASGIHISVWEPLIDANEVKAVFDVETTLYEQAEELDAVIVINGHDAFKEIELAELKEKMRTPLLMDIKNFFSRSDARELGFTYMSL